MQALELENFSSPASSTIALLKFMKNLNRNRSQVSPEQLGAYQRGKLQEELANYKHQSDQLWTQLEDTESQNQQLQQEAEAASKLVRQERKKNEGLLQRLMNAIQSRNSMRGRLGNMTAQRNRALRQVEKLATQNREVFGQLKHTTDKLSEAYQQIGVLQADYEQDMTELAQAYREVDPKQLQQLPPKLRQLLEQINHDYGL